MKIKKLQLAILILILVFFMTSCSKAAEEADVAKEEVMAEAVISSNGDPMEPIYRLYNPLNGEHLYTPDKNEADTLSASAGWEYEGIIWYAPLKGERVYRMNNPRGYHLYTVDTDEVRALKDMEWDVDNEGNPLFYSGGKIKVYRLYNPVKAAHLLTPDINEYNILEKSGEWVGEGATLMALQEGVQPEKRTDYINITIGDYNYRMLLSDSAAGQELAKKLKDGPISVPVNEYGKFEKVGALPFTLPREDVEMTAVPGDVMLYEGSQLAIFYGENTWEYTPIGKTGAGAGEMTTALKNTDYVVLWLD